MAGFFYTRHFANFAQTRSLVFPNPFPLMNYFQAEQISKSYGEKVLFNQVSFSVSQGEKLGLIARNGSGKTTLLNIIAGMDTADQGKCSYRKGLRLSYLQQEPGFQLEDTVSEALLSAGNELTRTVREYEEFMQESREGGAIDERILQSLIEKMDALEAWDLEQRIQQILTRLNIGNLRARVGTLSGGQQKRLALAKILIEEADFILLDEPTNHLDIDMIEWLEAYLSRQKLTLMVVTHDRYFLDTVCQGILELDRGNIYSYNGNYAHFLDKKQERLQTESSRSEKALNLLKKEQDWMRRSPPARTTKSKARIDSFHELKERAANPTQQNPGEIKLEMARMGKKILEMQGVEKSFGEIKVLDNFSHVFKKGERVGVAGPNGTGKTTLLRIITGQTEADKGSVVTGETIAFGFYQQEGLQVDEGKKVIEVISDIAESIDLGNGKTFSASQLLQYFNFPYPVQHNLVAKLSGGEKRRLYLVTVLMKKPNFLILDEPTNDLDIETLNVLEDFLAGFGGCLLIVSHDRYFLDRLVDHLFIFEEHGKVKGFTGNYTAYRLKKGAADKVLAGKTGDGKGKDRGKQSAEQGIQPAEGKQLTERGKQPAERGKQPAGQAVAGTGKSRQRKKLTYREQQEFEVLEREIGELEREKELLVEQMNSGSLPPDDLMKAAKKFEQLTADLERKGDRWLELSEWA
jgi:ABC transport system ATP-binding/permease protein